TRASRAGERHRPQNAVARARPSSVDITRQGCTPLPSRPAAHDRRTPSLACPLPLPPHFLHLIGEMAHLLGQTGNGLNHLVDSRIGSLRESQADCAVALELLELLELELLVLVLLVLFELFILLGFLRLLRLLDLFDLDFLGPVLGDFREILVKEILQGSLPRFEWRLLGHVSQYRRQLAHVQLADRRIEADPHFRTVFLRNEGFPGSLPPRALIGFWHRDLFLSVRW